MLWFQSLLEAGGEKLLCDKGLRKVSDTLCGVARRLALQTSPRSARVATKHSTQTPQWLNAAASATSANPATAVSSVILGVPDGMPQPVDRNVQVELAKRLNAPSAKFTPGRCVTSRREDIGRLKIGTNGRAGKLVDRIQQLVASLCSSFLVSNGDRMSQGGMQTRCKWKVRGLTIVKKPEPPGE